MTKFFINIVILVAVVVSGSACATAGYPRMLGGGELERVMAGNEALLDSIAGHHRQPFYGVPYSYVNVPVCRIQDLAGAPLVSQPMLIRVSKSNGRRTIDVIGAAAVGAGLGGLVGGKTGVVYGVATGAGAGLLLSNQQELCLLLPAPRL